MFKKTESENTIRTIGNAPVEVEGFETIPANATVPKGHRLWATYEAWLALGNTPEPSETDAERDERLAAQLRRDRDAALKASDTDVIRYLEQGLPVAANVKNYRTELRDIPDRPNFPGEVTLPTKPPLNL